MRRLLPILLILLGLGGGIGAGWFLKPPPAEKTGDAVDADGQNGGDENTKEKRKDAASIPEPGEDAEKVEDEEPTLRSYVNIGKQTIVPVVEGHRTRALMLFELAVDVEASAHDLAVTLEPRLRDAFLRELLKMSSTGAFARTYTEEWVIDELRRNLSAAARDYLGESLKEVLILDVIRQEM